MNSPHKLGWDMVGDWHFDASFGESRGLNVCLFFGYAEPLFAVREISLVAASRSNFLVTSVQASHCWGYYCCRAQALEQRLSTCVPQA